MPNVQTLENGYIDGVNHKIERSEDGTTLFIYANGVLLYIITND